MKLLLFIRACMLITLICAFYQTNAQISEGGIPPGLKLKLSSADVAVVELPAPVFRANEATEGEGLKPLLIGKSVPAGIAFFKKAVVDKTTEGMVYRLKVSSENAAALGLVFKDFYLPEGSKLFIYNGERILGAYTSANNTRSGSFAVEPLKGSEMTVEYFLPPDAKPTAKLFIQEVAYIFQQAASRAGFGDSDFCEVNINCPEGANWQDEARGVARIILKDGPQYWLCTGSLVNNTALDNSPYVLTANHCGRTSSYQDYDLWVFYFNYQADGCNNPAAEPEANTITGAELLAASYHEEAFASDFKLLKLNDNVPVSWNPYFNGWDYANSAPESGVCIHHPQGDIKKISTYNSPAVSSSWQGSVPNPGEKYWRVGWNETLTNHGVTEGGSSGSPLFDMDGYIVGTLTGGSASCNDPNAPDYFGKFWYHWDKNGDNDNEQLKPWLDPDNLGISSLKGMGINENQLVALFKSFSDTIEIGGSTSFKDLSSGAPVAWEWYFEGANPSTSNAQNPENIRWSEFGKYDVRLIVSNGDTQDTLLKKDFIYVKPIVGPIPSNGELEVFLGQKEFEGLFLEVFDLYGRKVYHERFNNLSKTLQIKLPGLPAQLYILRLEAENYSSVHKIILL